MSLANLFKVSYPSGLIQHIRDDAADVEALIAKISGRTLDEAKAMGLQVEQLFGIEDFPEAIGLGAPLASSAPAQPLAPAVVANPPAGLPPGDLAQPASTPTMHEAMVADVMAEAQKKAAVAAQAQARFNALREAAAAAVAKVQT